MNHIDLNPFDPEEFNNFVPDPTKTRTNNVIAYTVIGGFIIYVGYQMYKNWREKRDKE